LPPGVYLGRAPTFFATGSDSVLGFTKRDDKNDRTIYFYANCGNQDVELDAESSSLESRPPFSCGGFIPWPEENRRVQQAGVEDTAS
jgi:hypothetical protein